MSSAKRRGRFTPSLISGIVLLGLVVLTAIIAPLVLQGPADGLSSSANMTPTAQHLLGTDNLGRDILARALVASRLTLIMSISATALGVVGGVLLGSFVWVAPRRLREFLLRLIETAVAYPSLVLALIVAAILGPGTWSAVLAIGIANIPSFARLTANLAGSVFRQNYVMSSRLLGVHGFGLVTRHVLPNIAEALLVLGATNFAFTLVELSSLSFIGLGVQSPEYDFGRMLNDGLAVIYSFPLQALAPAAMIVITGLAGVLIGDGLAALSNPHTRRRRALGSRRTSKPSGEAQTHPDALLEVVDLTVTRPDGVELVHGLTFSMRAGEVLGLVGESGSGKSLTAMTIAGLLPDGLSASAETLRLGDLDLLGQNSPKRLATDIALIYQDPGTTFNPALRMGSQLTEVLRVHLGKTATVAKKIVLDGMERVRISQPAHRMTQRPYELSGGMLQRSMIVASMATNPKLMIADEPTTALDVTVQADVLRLFKQINKDNGTAILFISHDIGVVQALCDEVLVMNGGRILERTTGAALAAGEVQHPYTRSLLAATPSMLDSGAELPVLRWTPEETA